MTATGWMTSDLIDKEHEVDVDFRIEIPHAISSKARGKILKCQANIDDTKKKIKPLDIARKEAVGRLKQARVYLIVLRS